MLLQLGVTSAATAQPEFKKNWKAHWIGEQIETRPNTFLQFKKDFHLTKVPESAVAAIACDSKYWLWINGKLVVFEGQLKRGPTPKDTYFEEVNILPFLKQGENQISLLMWYWGKDGFCHKSSGQAGLIFQADLNTQEILSDETWKVAPHLAFQNSTAPFPNFRLPEFNIHYDARLGDQSWIHLPAAKLNWPFAVTKGQAGTAPWNNLWKRPFPNWKTSTILPYLNTTVPVEKKSSPISPNEEIWCYEMQLPYNTTVTPYLKIKSPAGLAIDIRTDNYFGGSEPNIRTVYITKNGEQEFESPAYFNGHKVIYSIPKGIEVLQLGYRETRFPTEQMGSFQSSNHQLNILWEKSYRTMLVNLRDAIQDPDRERAQWWGDVVIILEEIFYACDQNAIQAVKKSISNLVEWQKKDGVLFSPIPAGNWDKELPAQMLAAIGKYGFWKYFEYTGDTSMIKYVYPAVKKYLSLYTLQPNGLIEHRSGGWDWHDWGTKIDVPLLDNAWYYLALQGAIEMAELLQLPHDALLYKTQADTIYKAFQKEFWTGKVFKSKGYLHAMDDRGNGLAVCAGLASEEQWRQLKPQLDTTFHAGPYLEKYILEAYFIMNDGEHGIKRMLNRYQAMIASEVTTLWEGWAIGSGTYGGGSYNHGWSGGPLSILSKYVAGIQPTEPGYRSYIVKPQMSGLTTIRSISPTPLGPIEIFIHKKDGFHQGELSTISSHGVIALPKFNKNKSVNWKKIKANNDKSQSQTSTPLFIHQDKDYLYFEIKNAGTWQFTY